MGKWKKFTRAEIGHISENVGLWGIALSNLNYFDRILMSNMKVNKIVLKHFPCPFWGFLVTFICDVKIDVNMCEPHYFNFFVNLLHSPCVDISHLFDNLTSFWQFFNLNHLSPYRAICQQIQFWHILTEWSILGKTRLQSSLPHVTIQIDALARFVCSQKPHTMNITKSTELYLVFKYI